MYHSPQARYAFLLVAALLLLSACAGGVPPDGDLACAGVECLEGENCYGGTCFPTEPDPDPDYCDGVVCPDGYACYGGTCFETGPEPDPDYCDGIVCPAGYACYGGTCFPTEPDPDPDYCEGVVCPPGFRCHGGSCFEVLPESDPDYCEDVVCRDDQVCLQGTCFHVDPCDGVACDEGEECYQGVCRAGPCDGVTCREGFVCIQGSCFQEADDQSIPELCTRYPDACRLPDFAVGEINIPCAGQFPCIARDPVHHNCTVKFVCPDCRPGMICPPYHHMYFDGLDPDVWRVALYTTEGRVFPHRVRRTATGVVLSFLPDESGWQAGSIGGYEVGFALREGSPPQQNYRFGTRLEVSDGPEPPGDTRN
jgi:hypothetical protein